MLASSYVNYGLERGLGNMTGTHMDAETWDSLSNVNPWELVMKDMKLPGFPKSAEDEFKTQPMIGTAEQKSMMDNLFGSIDSIISMGVGAVSGVAKAVAGSIGSTFESVINYADHGIYEDDAAMRSRKVAALEDKISGLMDGFRTDKRDVTDAKLSEAMAMADELGIDASGLGKEIAAKRSALAAELASRSAAGDTGAGGSSSTAPMSYTDALVASGGANGVDQMVTYNYNAVPQPGMVESLLFTQMYAGEGPTVTVGDTIGSQTSNLTYTQAMIASGAVSGVDKMVTYNNEADHQPGTGDGAVLRAWDPPSFFESPTGWAKWNIGSSAIGSFTNILAKNVANVHGLFNWSNIDKLESSDPYTREQAVGSRVGVLGAIAGGALAFEYAPALANTKLGIAAKANAGFAAANGSLNAIINVGATGFFGNENTTVSDYIKAGTFGFGSGFASSYANLNRYKNSLNFFIGAFSSAGTDLSNGEQIDFKKAGATGFLNMTSQGLSRTLFTGLSETYTSSAKNYISDVLANISFSFPTSMTMAGLYNYDSSTLKKDINSKVDEIKKKFYSEYNKVRYNW